MNIDWSKAPEGATHYYKNSPEPWRDLSGYTWKYFMCGAWFEAPSTSTSDRLLRKLGTELFARPSPQAWTGEGQPPAGVECEVIDGERVTWEEGRKHLIGERVIVHASFSNGCDQLMSAFEVPRTNKCYVILSRLLRPARTPEQLAAEEREAEHQELMHHIAGYMGRDNPHSADDGLAKYLLDHDYRKQVAP